jgi:hypothetical protein
MDLRNISGVDKMNLGKAGGKGGYSAIKRKRKKALTKEKEKAPEVEPVAKTDILKLISSLKELQKSMKEQKESGGKDKDEDK